MDIEKAANSLDKADTFLTKLKNLLKNHWGILLILLFGYFIYWALTTEPEPDEQYIEEHYTEEPYVVDEYYYVNEYGDTLHMTLWSDGVEQQEN